MNHCSTVEERIQMVSQLLGSPTHGLVSQLSRTQEVSRQTLYRWTKTGREALTGALGGQGKGSNPSPSLPSLVLTMLIESHASYREIQACLKHLHGIDVSLGGIAGIVKKAGDRAQKWLEDQKAETPRALALDEQYSSQRGKAYLNVIDVHSGQVWATIPPVAVDGESWTLVLWYLREQGIVASCTVSDGGRAIQGAVSQIGGEKCHQRDIWHLLHVSAQVQGRLDRAVQMQEDRWAASQRQVRQEANGQRSRGRPPKTGVAEQQLVVARLTSVAEGVRYLCQELHTLLEVVVPRAGSMLSSTQRTGDIEAALELLEELALRASPAMQAQILMLAKQLRAAMPQMLLFACQLDAVQHQAARLLSPPIVAFLGWAWLRRRWLARDTEELLLGLAPDWRSAAKMLFTAWEQAVRASSVVENWHSIVRPHLAVHRTLSAGMLSLLAVWHNHRIAPRGVHEGLSPLQRTGSTTSSVHWLAALGYSPMAA
jgi:hypothetical protein